MAMDEPGAAATLISFLPLMIIGIPFAIGNYFLARRIDGASPVLWFVLSIIPFVNFVFFYYVGYKVVFAVLDHLRAMRGREAGA
jgi:hypothetical protein